MYSTIVFFFYKQKESRVLSDIKKLRKTTRNRIYVTLHLRCPSSNSTPYLFCESRRVKFSQRGDYCWVLWKRFIDFICRRLPRKRAQGSNLRKMQIGDSANFPRLDKLTGCQPYPPSQTRGCSRERTDRRVLGGWSSRDRGSGNRKNNCGAREYGKWCYLSPRGLADVVYHCPINNHIVSDTCI